MNSDKRDFEQNFLDIENKKHWTEAGTGGTHQNGFFSSLPFYMVWSSIVKQKYTILELYDFLIFLQVYNQPDPKKLHNTNNQF